MRRFRNIVSKLLNLVIIVPLLLSPQSISAQSSASHQSDMHTNGQSSAQLAFMNASSNGSPVQQGTLSSSTPLIGPGDEVEVTVYGAPDLSVHNRVAADGNVSVPLIGQVRIAGLSSAQAEGAIGEELRRENILNSPHVSVYVKEYGSSGISVVGEVAKPGVYLALGPHRLFDILQEAG